MTRCSTGRATQKYRGNGTDLSDILETPGDIIYADAAVSAENLVISGTTGDVLKVSASGIPEWGTSTSQWITSGDDISYSLGHVGIGTTSPDANLHVTGNAFVSTDLGLGGTLTMGNVLVEALHELSAITATGNVTPHVIEFTNPTTGLVTTGNVGIKTSTPLQTLEVNGSVGIKHDGVGGYTFHTSTGAMRAGIHSSAGNHLLFKAGANNERMRLLASGELGIGTSTPSKPLTVDGDVHIPSGSDANSGSFPQNSVTRSIYFGGISQSGSMYQSKTAIVSAPWTQYGGTQSWGRHGLHFCVDSVADNGNVELGQTKMCINYLGNVGIGSWSTSNPLPQTMASVHGGRVLEGRDALGFEFIAASSDTTNQPGQFNGAFLIKNMDANGSTPHYSGMAAREGATTTAGQMDLLFYSGRDNYENNTPQMVIDPDGNVGIGTSTPGYTLDVTGDINFTGNLIQNGSAYGSSPWTTTGNDISYTTGRVGVGTISPDANLHVEGNVYMSSNLEVGGATISRTVSYDVPSVSWATSIGGTNSDYGYGIATDSSGNVYVIGKYSGSFTIGSTTLTSAGSNDVFVAKYDTSGTVQWATSIGGTGNDSGGAIATDSNGNVYVAGYYAGSVTIGTTTLNSLGSVDVFVVKYSPPSILHINTGLEVSGDVNFTGSLTQNGSTFGSSPWVTSGSDISYTSGNVGIGTNSPQGTLHVSSGTAGDCRLILQADTDNNNEDDNPRIEFWQDGSIQESAIGMTSNRLNLWNSVGSGGIAFHTNTVDGYINAIERMTITSTGEVGIGATVPARLFHVNGTSRFEGEVEWYKAGQSTSHANFGANRDWYIRSGVAGGKVVIQDASTASYVGIGTSSPGYKLDVNGDINLTGSLRIGGVAQTFGGGGGSGGEWVIVNTNEIHYSLGNVGIGLSNPNYPLHVSGDIYATGNVTAYSDKRKKTNLRIIEDSVKKLEQINGYTYDKDGTEYTGLIAQEVLHILPQAVVGSEEEGYGLAYGNMVGILVEAIKELSNEVKILKEKLSV